MHSRMAGFLLFAPLLAAAPLLGAGCGDDTTSTTSTTTTTTSSSSGGGEGGSGGDGGAGGGMGGMGGGGGAGVVPVTITFEGRVGEEPFDCNATYTALGMAMTDVTITDFRLYIHDVRLHATDGTEVPVELDQDGLWQYKNVALLDFEDKSGACANGTAETNNAIHGMAPAGTYDGVMFRLGVPEDLNHADVAAAPSPLNLSGMFWNWNGGYKFLRVDSVPTVAGAGPFNLHVGSTGCTGDPAIGDMVTCDRPNIADIQIMGFDPLTTKVLVDYAAVVQNSDLSMNAGGSPGCMSSPMDPECAPVFAQLGIDIADGSIHPENQTFFRSE